MFAECFHSLLQYWSTLLAGPAATWVHNWVLLLSLSTTWQHSWSLCWLALLSIHLSVRILILPHFYMSPKSSCKWFKIHFPQISTDLGKHYPTFGVSEESCFSFCLWVFFSPYCWFLSHVPCPHFCHFKFASSLGLYLASSEYPLQCGHTPFFSKKKCANEKRTNFKMQFVNWHKHEYICSDQMTYHIV